MSATEETLRLLRSIDASLKLLVKQQAIEGAKTIASDRDLDGKYGDPVLKFMPREWTGPSFKGRRLSECPADLLDMVAETFDYFASKAEAANEHTDSGKPVAQYKRSDAARARGWAKRIRDGKHTPMTEDAEAGFNAAASDDWSGPDAWRP